MFRTNARAALPPAFNRHPDPIRLFQPYARKVQALSDVLGLFDFYVGAPVFFVFEEDRSAWFRLVPDRHAPLAIDFEDEHGGRFERDRYNQRNMDTARETRSPVMRRRNGLADFCVPVRHGGNHLGCIISGAIQERLMERVDLEAHYQRITQRPPHENPAQFSRYVRGFLSQPFVPRDLHKIFTSSLDLVAAALGEARRPEEILRSMSRLRTRHFVKRYLHRGWLEAVIWRKFHKMELELRSGPNATDWERNVIGLHRTPSVVMAAMPGGSQGGHSDHVDSLLAAQRLQESARRLARSFPNTIVGGTEEFGTILLTSHKPGATESQARLQIRDLAATLVRGLEKDLSFRVHIGIGRIEPWNHPLEHSYHDAVHSMMWASYSNLRVCAVWDRKQREPENLSEPEDLGRQILDALRGGSRAQLDTARDLYWQSVLGLCGRRVEPLQVYMRNIVGLIAYFLEKEVNIGESTAHTLSKLWTDRIAQTDEVERLGALFRKMVDEFHRLRLKPKDGPGRVTMELFAQNLRKRSFQPMRLDKAAASIGVSIPVFCRKFKAFTGHSFIDYINRIRIEEAKHFLTATKLSISQIGRETGFNTASYFIRVFRNTEGTTPARYRASKYRLS